MTDETKIAAFGAEARRELLHQRVLVLDGVLDDDNGTLIATQLLALAAEDEASDISLWIHSPGGSVASMLAIRDVMPSRIASRPVVHRAGGA
jgi:ATP-dependent Clp protease protease subunit